jgi:histidine triad (HIT) family protein
MSDCIFCKIITGELPSNKVYETDSVLAFLDIAPVNAGHTLVVPKAHYEFIEDVTPADAVQTIGAAIKSGLGVAGYNIGLNNGRVAGQLVPHVHFHIMPRLEGDNLKLWPQRKYEVGEDTAVLEKIKSVL